jgi:hypothetical protein
MTIVVAAAALALAGCGDDDDDGGGEAADTLPGGVTVPEDVTVPAISLPDITVPDISLPDISLPDISLPDISLPDISLPDISLPDISIPDISLPDQDAMERIIASIFPNLNEEQISCLAEAFGENFDPSEAAQLAEDCDIEASDLQPGG